MLSGRPHAVHQRANSPTDALRTVARGRPESFRTSSPRSHFERRHPVFDEHPDGSNTSGNPSLSDLIEVRLGRRRLLQGAAVASLAGVLAPQLAVGRPSTDDTIHRRPDRGARRCSHSSPEWAEDASNTAADQACRSASTTTACTTSRWRAVPRATAAGLLVLNHEYTDANQIYTAAQGSAITRTSRRPREGGQGAGRARRHRGRGPPAAKAARGARAGLAATAASPARRRWPSPGRSPRTTRCCSRAITPSPIGTLNNCAHGVHAVGHLPRLRGELERLLRHRRPAWVPTPLEARYGVTGRASATTGTRPSPASTSP
jgi:uncharacterized protein